MKIKTSELQYVALDWAVAKCLGHRVVENYGAYIRIYLPDQKQSMYTLTFCPSAEWSQGGPIIEREKISLRYDCIDIGNGTCGWVAESWDKSGEHFEENGPTPLIAAMRCYVAGMLGDEVDVPNELTEAL
jgi:hypothetical protein